MQLQRPSHLTQHQPPRPGIHMPTGWWQFDIGKRPADLQLHALEKRLRRLLPHSLFCLVHGYLPDIAAEYRLSRRVQTGHVA